MQSSGGTPCEVPVPRKVIFIRLKIYILQGKELFSGR
jgi:hypothetical protein